MQRHAIYVWSILTDDKQVYKTRLSTVSIGVFIWQVLWSIQRPCWQIKSFARSNSDWRFFIIMVRQLLFTKLYTDFFLFSEYDKEHRAGVTSQQRMLTPQLRLILFLIFRGLCFFCSWFEFSFGLLILNTVRYYHNFMFWFSLYVLY